MKRLTDCFLYTIGSGLAAALILVEHISHRQIIPTVFGPNPDA